MKFDTSSNQDYDEIEYFSLNHWNENYKLTTPGGIKVLDGIVWSLEIDYHGYQMKSYGKFDLPKDFESFKVNLEKKLNKPQHKYGDKNNVFNFNRDEFGRIRKKRLFLVYSAVIIIILTLIELLFIKLLFF